MLELHIGNVLTKIVGDIPAHVKSMIREQCAYSIKGAEFSTYGAATYCPICKKNTEQLTWEEKRSCPQDGFMYRKCHMHGLVKPVSLWDGRKFLFDARSENFPTGVISRVTSVLKTFGVPYKIIDERIVPYTRRLTWHGPQLRYYQKDAVNSLITKSRGIVQACTGAGKTRILSALAAEIGVNTLILTHTAAVFNQVYETIKKDLKMPIGRIGDGYDEPGKITVAMPQSLVGSIKVPKRKLVKGVWKTVNSSVAVIKDKYKDFLVNTEALYIDECFQYNTLVKTERGYEKIGRLVEQGKKVRVYCFNKDLNKFVLMPIAKFYKKESPRELVQLKFNDTFLYLTPNHEVYILDKAPNSITKKRADQLTVSDCVIIQQGDSYTYGTRAVKSIRLVKSFEKFVYNIEVEEHHNYLVTRENILVSNCHRVACDTVQLVANSCVNAYFRIGVSATPYRADLLDILIEAATGKVNFKYTATQAIADGYLSKPNIHLVRFPQKPYPRKKLAIIKDSKTGQLVEKEVPVKYADLYKDRVTNNKQRNLVIANIAYKHFKKNESVLIIVRHLEHGENLYNELKYLGPTVKWVNGENDTEELKQVLQELNTGTCKICIASGIFNEGIDVTGLNVCINTTACDSPVTAMQILGRTLRRTSTKTEVDFYDMYDYGVRWLGEHAANRLEMYKTEPGFLIQYNEYTDYLK